MLSRFRCRILLGIALAWCAVVAAEEKPIRPIDPASPSAVQVKQLVERLGDNDYRVREKATEVLASLGEEIHLELRQNLLAKPKAEVELRLRTLLDSDEDRRLIAPALCVSNYCMAVCNGNEEAARKCLSRSFLERLDNSGMFPAPPVAGAYTFKVDAVEHKIAGETTVIGSTWFYHVHGKPRQISIGYFLTREVDGWKVSLIEDPSIIKSSSNLLGR
jgi:hypothetical protein